MSSDEKNKTHMKESNKSKDVREINFSLYFRYYYFDYHKLQINSGFKISVQSSYGGTLKTILLSDASVPL